MSLKVVTTKYVVDRHVSIEVHINEPTRIRVKCTIGCACILFASFNFRTNNFIIKTCNSVYKFDPTNRNKLCKKVLIHLL